MVVLTLRDEILAQCKTHTVRDSRAVEQLHPTRDPDQHILGDVDLHQNQQLVQSAKDVADRGEVDPLEAIDAEEVLLGTLMVLACDDEVTSGHGQH